MRLTALDLVVRDKVAHIRSTRNPSTPKHTVFCGISFLAMVQSVSCLGLRGTRPAVHRGADLTEAGH